MALRLTLKKAAAAALAPALFATAAFFANPVQAEDGPALWKLSDEDSNIYLFGTVHLLKPDTVWRSDKVTTAFKGSETVYFEAAVEETPQSEMMAIIQPYALNPAGVTFSNRFSPEDFSKIKELSGGLGIPEAALKQFDPYRPWIIGLNLTVQNYVQNGFNPESGVDKLLFKEAKAASKDVKYLESVETQIKIFGTLSSENENAYFIEMLEQLGESSTLLNNLVTNWASGKPEEVGALMNEAMQATPALAKVALYDRNENWAEQIDELMKGSGDIFIAVGAGHLAGKNSVQELLEAKGHKVVRQ
ncbi:TraB/GumN family protein [Kordiimonas laminariae]|uniref:TraB/GumN family protein n=1 Tax=Kordiimonas laminariae TaxID=2917717 RepID=UPI001FF39BDB|nr:TraB/GumN family protein [Kordiimonas laminariae]MCK0067880.1 TraB/GumN family protein [Kordiimonas laminariae]